MARVTLQEYCAEAQQRIDQRAYDEAIAICRHILQRYPTHVITYQILGQACLAKGDFDEAERVFKRLLGQADPENFAAYAGLGAIREGQGKYNEAIWYMERAFELIPNRDQVRQALRRLYGKRDGTVPTRIRLNKAALARLYARGGQYQQAIQELRTLLAEQPYHDRIDLKLSLAETLWRDSQHEEAADMARQVLEVCPNCLKAMLLLGQVLIEKGLVDEGEALLNETRRLDPENNMAQAVFDGGSPLPHSTVRIPTIDRMDDEASFTEAVQTGSAHGGEPSGAEAASSVCAEPSAEPVESASTVETGQDSVLEATAVIAQRPSSVLVDVTGAASEVELDGAAAGAEIELRIEPAPGRDDEDEQTASSEQALGEGEAAAQAVHEPEVRSEQLNTRSEPRVDIVPETLSQPDELGTSLVATPDEIELASAPGPDTPPSDVERYRLRLEKMPKDHDTRLLLARAYRDQEQMRLALEQYSRLLQSKKNVLAHATQDIETIVASRPDNLEAHELLADFYAKSGKLQEAVDRYRWVLQRLEEETD